MEEKPSSRVGPSRVEFESRANEWLLRPRAPLFLFPAELNRRPGVFNNKSLGRSEDFNGSRRRRTCRIIRAFFSFLFFFSSSSSSSSSSFFSSPPPPPYVVPRPDTPTRRHYIRRCRRFSRRATTRHTLVVASYSTDVARKCRSEGGGTNHFWARLRTSFGHANLLPSSFYVRLIAPSSLIVPAHPFPFVPLDMKGLARLSMLIARRFNCARHQGAGALWLMTVRSIVSFK
jgi:hypothetical protein